MGKFPWRYYSFTLKLQWRLCLTLCVFQSNNYYYIWIIIESRWWAQVSSPVGFSSKRARAHCHLQTESFIGKKDLVRGGGIFPLWLIHCPLLQVSKNWVLCSGTGAWKQDISVMDWWQEWDTARDNQGARPCVLAQVLVNKSFPWEPISMRVKQLLGQAEFKMAWVMSS
jgi:hypothetical protein